MDLADLWILSALLDGCVRCALAFDRATGRPPRPPWTPRSRNSGMRGRRPRPARAVDAVLGTGVSYDDALRRLQTGPPVRRPEARRRHADEQDGRQGRALLRRHGAAGLRPGEALPGPFPAARRRHGTIDEPAAQLRRHRRARRRRAVLRDSVRLDRRAVVERGPGPQHERHRRLAEAHVQHRREPRRRVGRFGRRHGRVLPGDARDDAVCELPAAQRLHHGAGERRHRHSRSALSRTTSATSRSSWSTADAIGCIPRPPSSRTCCT